MFTCVSEMSKGIKKVSFLKYSSRFEQGHPDVLSKQLLSTAANDNNSQWFSSNTDTTCCRVISFMQQ